MLVVLYLTTHFNNSHTPKVNGINTAKVEIYTAHIAHIENSKKENSKTFDNLATTKNYFIEVLQDKHWFSFFNICSNEQPKGISTILEQLYLFEKQITKQKYTSKQEYNTLFYSLINNIDKLQTGLNKKYLSQQNTLHYARIIIVIALLLFILGVLFIATKRKDIREKILKGAQKANYHLTEAQNIAKLIPYSYDFKKNHWEVSMPNILDLIGHKASLDNDNFWLDIIHPTDKLRISNLFNLRENNLSGNFNEIYRIINTSTQKIHWIHHVIQGIKQDKKGKFLPILGIIQDITQYKLTEEKLKRSNTILDKINSLVLVIDSENNITYASKGVNTILGYTPEDILGQGWWKLSYPDTKSAQKTKDLNYEYFFNQNSSLTSPDEFSIRRIKTKSGKYKWVQWSFTKENENSFIAIGVDVTSSHKKSRKYIALTESAHDAIILANDKGVVIDINKTTTEMFGYSKKEILGKPVLSLMPKKHIPSFLTELKKANKKETSKKNQFRKGQALTKDGIIIPVEISFSSWIDDGVQTHCAFIKDISKRKHEEKVKEIIYNITQYAQEKPTLGALLPFIKENLSAVIDTSNLYVSLYDAEKQLFNSYEEIDSKKVNQLVNFPKGVSFFDQIINTKKSLLYTQASKTSDSKINFRTKNKCWIGVPLIVKDKAIGVMSMRSRTNENAYTEKDISLLELVASTISRVIQQSKSFERITLLNEALVQSSAMIIITNPKGVVEFVNNSYTKNLGYTSDEILGEHYGFLGINDKKVVLAVLEIASKGKSWSGEFVNVRKDGSHFIVAATMTPVKNNTGEITHYISVQDDITERRKLEDIFVNGFIEAQEIEKQRFGQELHDGISQILSAEAMYINVLIKENQDRIKGKAKFLTKIKELNLSVANETRNIAHGLLSHQLVKTGLIKAIESVCIDYSDTENIEFTYRHENISDNELSKEIQTNLFRAIQEITTNIIRHSKASKVSITLKKLKNKRMLNLVIKDNGIGIDYDEANEELKGIGFDNIKRRITLLKGTLNIKTSLNKGVSFTINIPL